VKLFALFLFEITAVMKALI